jgi:hypothetical protein
MKWYEMSEPVRIKEVFSQFKIKEFWDFWSSGEEKIMEIRIKDYQLIKDVATNLNLKWSSSGVYVNNCEDLKKVIKLVRDKATIWFGINPRKMNYNQKGFKSFGSGKKGGSSDENIDEIAFLFCDIDRVVKQGAAKSKDLMNSDILCDKILERLETEKWHNGFCKICSGNGGQLLIKLDFPIRLPNLTFNMTHKIFEHSDEFEKLKNIIKKGIGAEIVRFSNKLKKELGVEIDKSVFNINRVGALPVTKNFKFDGFTWRGIIDMKDGVNEGLSDYILSKEYNYDFYKNKKPFKSTSSALQYQDRMIEGKLNEHKLIRFMLDEPLPYGSINNKLWFSLKILLRDSKINLNSVEFKSIHNQLENKVKGSLTTNLPDKKYNFNPDVINSYCIDNCIPPLYPLYKNKNAKFDMKLEGLSWDSVEFVDGIMELDDETLLNDDMLKCRNLLTPGSYGNVDIIAKFMKGCIKKYGEEKTKYLFENKIFEKYLVSTVKQAIFINEE